MEVTYGAKSDRGLKRGQNEDCFCSEPELGLFVVCDGMGGQQGGEVASRLAVDAIRRHCLQAAKDPNVEMFGVYDPQFFEQTNRLASAVRHANHVVHGEAQNQPRYAGMGTTVVAILLREQILSLAHVGDSRVYLIRGEGIQPLTQDHSLVMDQVRGGLLTEEQAERSDQKHVLTRALGVDPTVDVELSEVPLTSGDRVLLCSDGLTRMIDQRSILEIVRNASEPQGASSELIETANSKGGVDNTTVVLIEVRRGSHKSLWQRIRDRMIVGKSASAA